MKNALVVDDSPVIRKVLRRMLETMEFQTAEAGEAGEALEQCRALMPEVIMLDGYMPGMDGFEFLRELRRQPWGHRPKVVWCISENDIAQIARALHAGADEYMMKPFDRELVAAKIEQLGLD